jgi:hypothetical protein
MKKSPANYLIGKYFTYFRCINHRGKDSRNILHQTGTDRCNAQSREELKEY